MYAQPSVKSSWNVDPGPSRLFPPKNQIIQDAIKVYSTASVEYYVKLHENYTAKDLFSRIVLSKINFRGEIICTKSATKHSMINLIKLNDQELLKVRYSKCLVKENEYLLNNVLDKKIQIKR